MSEQVRSEQPVFNIGPRTGVLRAYYEANLGWPTAIGELVDNAFDAGATRVALSFGKENGTPVFVCQDDGDGCESNAVLLSLVTIGEHRGRATTRLGRYGIGGKESMLWIGGPGSKVYVDSTHGKTTRLLRLDWDQLEAGGNWDLPPDSLHEFHAHADDRGTRIKIASRSLRRFDKGTIAHIEAALGYIYAPAIKQGRQITIRLGAAAPTVVKRYELPSLEPGFVHADIEVDGKKARVHVGIVPPGVANPKYGITYTHGFRVIAEASERGCGEYGSARVAGIVDLLDGWVLNKNKDGISRDADRLYAAVFDVCRDMLKRAADQAKHLEFAALESKAAKLLNQYIGAAPPDTKAKRGKGDERGTKEPTGRGGKHNRAENTQDGKTFAGRQGSGLKIEFQPGDAERIGTFNGSRVVLHTSHPAVAQVQRDDDARCTAYLAAALVSVDSLLGEQRKLWERSGLVANGGTRDTYERALGLCLRGVSLDGAKVVEQPKLRSVKTEAA